jgi:hypothetical protein
LPLLKAVASVAADPLKNTYLPPAALVVAPGNGRTTGRKEQQRSWSLDLRRLGPCDDSLFAVFNSNEAARG